MNKKIVISINTSWNIINFRVGLLKALQKNGYKIIIVAPYDQYTNLFKEYQFEYYNIQINNKGLNPLEDMLLIINYYRLFKLIQPDIILNYTIKPNIYGTIAASMLNIPTINNIAGLGTLFVKENFVTTIAQYLYRFSQSRASKIFFQNRDDYQLFIDKKIVSKTKSFILPGSGIDTKIFKPSKINKEQKKVIFLLISRMIWDKGIREYVEAARIIKSQYKNVEFQLLGFLDVMNKTAIAEKQMLEWVEEGVVNYLGTSDNIKIEIENADCIVLPSFYREGTPRVLLEAASMSKPIITTDNVGCRDVVDDGINGFLCKVKDTNSLVESLKKFLNLSYKEKLEMGKLGRKKICKEYDESIIIENYLREIKKILN